jgi:hypothetical protein
MIIVFEFITSIEIQTIIVEYIKLLLLYIKLSNNYKIQCSYKNE